MFICAVRKGGLGSQEAPIECFSAHHRRKCIKVYRMGCIHSLPRESRNKRPKSSAIVKGEEDSGSSGDGQECIGGYLIKKKIAKGNYGVVHLCSKDGDEYACKVINKRKLAFQATREERRAMEEGLENEIGALKCLEHPNIVQLYHVEEKNDVLYLMMELMHGGELFDYIITKNTLSEREASSIIQQVAHAVAYCHAKGIIHRDLKPENLLLAKRKQLDQVKIADFGFAKTLPSGELHDC